MTEADQVIIKALSAIISPNNLVEEDVGGKETYSTIVKKVEEPEEKNLEGNVEFNV